jgi:hypothetical protein
VATFEVVGVRMAAEVLGDEAHDHIVGVVTSGGVYYSNAEVVASLRVGKVWVTRVADAPPARIRPMVYCPVTVCMHRPYLTTAPDHSERNNLEGLPRVG